LFTKHLKAACVFNMPPQNRSNFQRANPGLKCFFPSISTDAAKITERIASHPNIAVLFRSLDKAENLRAELALQFPTFDLMPNPFTFLSDRKLVSAGFMALPFEAPALAYMNNGIEGRSEDHVRRLLEVYRSLPIAVNNNGIEGYEAATLFADAPPENTKRIVVVGGTLAIGARNSFKHLIKKVQELRRAYPASQIGLVSNCHCTIYTLADAGSALEDACDAIIYGPWDPKMGEGADLVVTIDTAVALDGYLRGLPVDCNGLEAFGLDLNEPGQQDVLMQKIDRMSFWDLPTQDQPCNTETAFRIMAAQRMTAPVSPEFNLPLVEKILHQVQRLVNVMDYDGAVALLEGLLEKTPSDTDLLSRLGDVHLDQDALSQAEACFSKIIDTPVGAKNPKPLVARAFQQRAKTRIKMGMMGTQPRDDLRAAIRKSSGTDYALWSQYFDFEWERAPVNEVLLQSYQKVANRFMKDYPKVGPPKVNFLSRLAAMQFEAGLQSAAERTIANALARREQPASFLYMHVAIGQKAGMRAPAGSRMRALEHVLANRAMFTDLLDVADGDIAIVGNGPQELGRGRGAEIDSHKMVVRFNTYSTSFPQSHDYGGKTDLWVRMPATGYVKSDDANTCPNVMLTGVNRLYRASGLWGWVDSQITGGNQLSFMPKEPIYELVAKLGKVPTAGMALAYMLYRDKGPVDPDVIFGCSFAESSSPEMAGYHHSDSAATMGPRHDFDVEHAFFQTIRKGADRSYYLPAEQRALRRDIPTRSIRVPEAPEVPWTLAGQIGRFDRVLSASPGLKGYTILGCEVEVMPRKEIRKLLLTSPATLLAAPDDFPSFSAKEASRHRTLVLGFGLGPTGQLGQDIAKHLGMTYMSVEYGLISSCHLPSERQFNFSLQLDDIGAFFDSEHRSRLEMILDAGFGAETSALTARARAFMNTVLAHNITKYNNAPQMLLPARKANEAGKIPHRILIIDQTSGDLSIKYGQCETHSFQDMLEHAMDRARTEGAEVFFKPHPETMAGAKGANFEIDALRRRAGLVVLEENANIMSLMPQVDEVYVMVSGVGFEALMAGKTVRCFGVPFYAARGLTIDMVQPSRPRRPLSIEELVAGVFLQYHQFYDPDSKEPTTPEAALEGLIPKLPSSIAYVHDGTDARLVSLEYAPEAAAFEMLRQGNVPIDLHIAANLLQVGDTVADVADGTGLITEGLAKLGTFRVHAITENAATIKILRELTSEVIAPQRKLVRRPTKDPASADSPENTDDPRTDRLDGLLEGEPLTLLRLASSKRTIDILETSEGMMEKSPPRYVMVWLTGRELPRATAFLARWYAAPRHLIPEEMSTDTDEPSLYLFQLPKTPN
jgi:Capsule polysaccharide biosynthesis protein